MGASNFDKKVVKPNHALNFILASNNQDYAKTVTNVASQSSHNFVTISDFHQVAHYIQTFNDTIHSFFLDPHCSQNDCKEILHTFVKTCPTTPLYIVDNGQSELAKSLIKEKESFGIQGSIRNEKELISTIKKVVKHFEKFNFNDAIKTGSQTKVDLEKDADNALLPIDARNFVCGNKSIFDVYIKLNEKKYIQVLHAGDSFDQERLDKYFKKGLRYLYIKKEAQKYYLDFCSKLTSKTIESNKIKTSVKLEQTFNQGQEVINFLKNSGINSESIEVAKQFTDNTFKLIKKIDTKDAKLNNIIGKLVNFEHTAGVTMIAGILSKEFGVVSSDKFETLGIACALHDLGLHELESHYKHQEEDIVFDEDIIEWELFVDKYPELKQRSIPRSRYDKLYPVYQKHPEIGAELARKIPNVDPIIPQIIAQHHERTDGSGFPGLVRSTLINPMAQVLGISDEYAKVAKLISQKRISQEALKKLPELIEGFPRKLRETFLSKFYPGWRK